MTWIAVSKELPKDEQGVIFYLPCFGIVEAGYYHAGLGGIFVVGAMRTIAHKQDDVSHWMPFPDPPNEDSESI